MAPMGTNADQWIADVTTFLRSSFGNAAPAVSAADVAAARASSRGRTTQWTQAELAAMLPRPLVPDATWTVSASHNAAAAPGALNFTRWTSGVPQQAGMWLRIDLPRVASLTELQFESAPVGGARGGPPPAGTFPRAYRVEVSMDGMAWSGPVAIGEGNGRVTTATFAPVAAKAIRITQTAAVENAPIWSVERLRLFEAPAGAPGGLR